MTRHCDYCGQDSDGSDKWGGPDPCIAGLEGVISACCGHGHSQGSWEPYAPYLFLEDGSRYAAQQAIDKMRQLGGSPPDVPQPSHLSPSTPLSAVSRERA